MSARRNVIYVTESTLNDAEFIAYAWRICDGDNWER